MFDKSYYACVLWSRSAQQAYTLVTDDPGESLHQHNLGSYVMDTAQRRPWELVHTRKFETEADARTWEERLKSADREQFLFELIGLDPAKFRT